MVKSPFSTHSQALVHAHSPGLQVFALDHPSVDTLQVAMLSTAYPAGKQGEALMDTADRCQGGKRSLNADTEADVEVGETGVQMVNLHSK